MLFPVLDYLTLIIFDADIQLLIPVITLQLP